jgi:23S rRNA pseudouridine1911/1915/1917 synthase
MVEVMMEILYSDKQIVVIVKPVGMDSEHEVPAALGGEIHAVHRLDKNVGGVMVYARTRTAAAALSKAIQEGTMIKEYTAIVHGTPPEKGDWEDLLWKDSKKNKVFVVKRIRGGVKKARLEFTRLTAGDTSLVHIRLHTGRSHQIRVQFSSRGFPLVGDHKYGARDDHAAPFLFSSRITFPYMGKSVTYEALPSWGIL